MRGLFSRNSISDALLAAAAGACALYVAYKAAGAAGTVGYDIRFFWAAGRLWLEGINPYTDDFALEAQRIVKEGFLPTIWPYPPNLLPFCTLLGLMSLQNAAAFLAAMNAVFLIGASAMLAAIAPVGDNHRFRWFCIHFVVMSLLEAAALTIVVGQVSLLIYFAAALTLFGLARQRSLIVAVGVALLMMKPQVGLLLTPLLLFAGPVALRGLLGGAAISIAFCLPAFFISASTATDWLGQVMRYDGVGPANAVTAMTGARAALYAVAGVDIGNLAAMAVAAAAAYIAGFYLLRRRRSDAGSHLVASGALATVALAPLHIYDFLLIGVCAAHARGLWVPAAATAALGAGMIWRSENLARATGFHDPDAMIFPGSALATFGALIVAVSVIASQARARVHAAQSRGIEARV